MSVKHLFKNKRKSLPDFLFSFKIEVYIHHYLGEIGNDFIADGAERIIEKI